jgi:hypothetical protein
MSFLDNLENNLKALESQEEKDPQALARKAAQREAARSAALEIAPHAEALRNGPFKDELRPTPSGVLAVFFQGGVEQERTTIDLSSDPVKVAEKWLTSEG